MPPIDPNHLSPTGMRITPSPSSDSVTPVTPTDAYLSAIEDIQVKVKQAKASREAWLFAPYSEVEND